MKNTLFTLHLNENTLMFSNWMGKNSDLISRSFSLKNNQKACLFYFKTMVDAQNIQESIIEPLLSQRIESAVNFSYINNHLFRASELKMIKMLEEAAYSLFEGSVILFMNDIDYAIEIPAPDFKDRTITDSKVDTVVKGPQDSFTELATNNISLIRQRLKNPKLQMISTKLGEKTRTDVSVLYLKDCANQKLVNEIQERLQTAKLDRVLESRYIEEVIQSDHQRTIFPLTYSTDRPDVLAAGLADGRIAIVIDGSPFALLLPTGFTDFFKSAEDYYQPSYYSSLIRLLRYVALCICLFTPAIYIALTTFHQDMIPTSLLLSISAQREGIPFPALVEALLMEITFEILREAGLRMPRTIGQAVSIVGTLVVGQAAVEASIVSAAMVIVVAITAISSFVIPSYMMSIPIRLLRFIFMIFASVFGIYGITIAVLLLVIHLCHLHSYGSPYMEPIAPYDSDDQADTLLRLPFKQKSLQNSEAGGKN
ncbi:hypothetical protein BTS2_1513 [Bacillus sp. TS-2]|nr:hypothetical protein BTS2_1513 [Bacillus sp. TS-2]